MAVVKTGTNRPQGVPAPTQAKFIHGTYPPSPSMQRVKPMAGQTQYGKQPKLPPLAGNTGLTGET